MKVLVVDDDLVCLHAIKNLLIENYHCEVDVAESPSETLNLIYKKALEWEPQWYDVIFMDILMPNIKGDVLSKVIRETEVRMKHTPIIAITSKVTPEQQAQFLQCGVTEVVLKPITKEKLDHVFKTYFKGAL